MLLYHVKLSRADVGKASLESSRAMDGSSVTNSDYAGDLVTRRKISIFLLYVLYIQVSWRSQAERIITIFRLMGEWVALSEDVDVKLVI